MRISDWSSDVCSSDLRIGGARFCRAIFDIFEPVGYLYPPRLCTGQNAWRLVAEGWDRLIERFRIFTGQHIVNDALHFMRWNIQRLVLWRAGGIVGHNLIERPDFGHRRAHAITKPFAHLGNCSLRAGGTDRKSTRMNYSH